MTKRKVSRGAEAIISEEVKLRPNLTEIKEAYKRGRKPIQKGKQCIYK